MPIINISLAILFSFGFLFFFLPVEKLIKKLLDLSVPRPVMPLFAILAALGILVAETKGVGLIYILLAAFSLWAFALGFLSDRKYSYTLALVFLLMCPFLLTIKMDKLAEFFAVLCYLCLVLGVLRDLFYEKLTDQII